MEKVREITPEQQEIMQLKNVIQRKDIVIEELLKIITNMTNKTWYKL